ncbi:SusC/RagA family TonB-linked outer membrane protein [Reichenbachiella sp. MALMAid0571]|uniref:SusC/RagA family TonB-linked outer membrane protein n=1 Tax=Reichenbachiella sp. MALMAid0571 TaxID=3143939 RepID=UPI0032DE3826
MKINLQRLIIYAMKLSFVGIFSQCLLLNLLMAGNTEAQKKTSVKEVIINIDVKEASVLQLFEKLEEKTQFQFTYDYNTIAKNKARISLSEKQKSVEEVLLKVSKEARLRFRQVDNNINVNPLKGKLDSAIEIVAADVEISGKILDENGKGLPGALIVEKGTTNGSTTDLEGNYKLVLAEGATITVSFVGYLTQDIVIGSQSVIDVYMQSDNGILEEVVVVGYGTSSKQAVTGAVATADLDTYNQVPVNNVIETVKGTLPGLNVSGINSAGQVAEITVRGQNSIGASNAPLVVVDGIIYNGSLGDIRSGDIESLTVLKDASAAAIYGARSANGVILIETKKGGGMDGKPRFNLKLVNGVSNQLEPNPVYTDGYFQNILDIREAQGLDADPNLIDTYLTEEEQKNYNATPDHKFTVADPNKLGIRQGYFRSADVSMSNNTAHGNYFISLGYTGQEGVVINDNFKQFTARINNSTDLTDWLNFSVLTSASLRDFSGSEPSVTAATRMSPYASIYDENGDPVRYPNTTTSVSSPLYSIATEHLDRSNSLNGAFKLRFDVPWLEGLSFTSTYSNNFRWGTDHRFYGEFTGRGEDNSGAGDRSYSSNYYRLFDNLISFNRLFADKHLINVTMLYSREQTTWQSEKLEASGFDNYALGSYGLSNGTNQSVQTGGGESAAIGQMGRVNYTYDDKYSVTATLRRDGYSAFSENNKWGLFSSIGINWNIIEESFMSGLDAVSNLALSASYGSVGNRSIDPYTTLARISTDKVIFADNNDYIVTQGISSLANADLGWEKTIGLNVGLGFGVIKNRVTGRLDFYSTTTTDLIFELPVPFASGAESEDVGQLATVLDNIGEIKNKGFELSINSQNIVNKDFSWTSNFNYSINRNKIETIFGEDNDGDGKEDDLPQSNLFIGKSLGAIYDTRVIGMWQEEDSDIMTGLRPGDYLIEDINGDGVISSEDDRQIIGNTNPNFRWSLTNTFKYKDFSLMAYVYSIWGGKDWYLSGENNPHQDFGVDRTDINHPIYDYWTPTNTGAEFPRPDYGDAAYRSKKYYDRSFIKLQKVALSYDFSRLVEPTGINGLTLTLSADNLWLHAPHWDGLDPETEQGLTNDARPSIRTYLLSLSANF